jgi:hypothetical protein
VRGYDSKNREIFFLIEIEFRELLELRDLQNNNIFSLGSGKETAGNASDCLSVCLGPGVMVSCRLPSICLRFGLPMPQETAQELSARVYKLESCLIVFLIEHLQVARWSWKWNGGWTQLEQVVQLGNVILLALFEID